MLITVIYSFIPEFIPSLILKLGDRPFIYWLTYVYVGIALARNEFMKANPFFVFTLLLIPVELYNFQSPSSYLRLTILVSSILTTAYIVQQKWLDDSNLSTIKNIISKIGQNTMIIFVSNPIIILLIEKATPNDVLHKEYNHLYTFLFSVLTTTVILFYSLSFKARNYILSRLLIK